MFTSRNERLKPSVERKSPFLVTDTFESLVTRFKYFYSLIIDFKLNFVTFFVKKDYNWMFTSRNVMQKPFIENKTSFIVTYAFKSFVSPFKWLYNLIIDFKLSFFTFLVKTDYNSMFTSRNVTQKPFIEKKNFFYSHLCL